MNHLAIAVFLCALGFAHSVSHYIIATSIFIEIRLCILNYYSCNRFHCNTTAVPVTKTWNWFVNPGTLRSPRIAKSLSALSPSKLNLYHQMPIQLSNLNFKLKRLIKAHPEMKEASPVFKDISMEDLPKTSVFF